MAGNQPLGEFRDEAAWTRTALTDPLRSPGLRRVAIATCAGMLVLILLGVGYAVPGQSPLVMAATTFALAVGLGGMGWHILWPRQAGVPRWLLLTAVGLAGATIIGLVPASPGYLITFTALFAIGMELPPTVAFGAGLAVAAAANAAALLAGQVSVTNLVGNDMGAAFLFSIGVFTRANRIARAQARAEQARAEQLLAQLRAAQGAVAANAALTERTRVAREVHDILAHSLSGLVLALDAAELLGRRGDDDPRTMGRLLEQLSRAQRIARDGLAETRRAVSALRGGELPGPALLRPLVEQTCATTGLRATLTVAGEQRQLSPEAGLAVYRTAQEALINSAKYAGRGGTAALRLCYGAEEVSLEVTDVRSPDAQPPPPGGLTFGGYGLTGIRERAELLDGRLTAGPTPDGFRVLLQLPAGAGHTRAETG